jgi:HPt (histidine-containing phosphotransfer) domain-containing protein
LGGIDNAALKRADMAMDTLQDQFVDMMESDVKALMRARAKFTASPDTTSRADLMRAAHDIKGNAPTFHFPLIARVAGSLSRLLGELPKDTALPAGLIDAHVNAVQVIHRQNIQTLNDKMAQTLCAELDARVEELLPKKAK